MSFPKNGDMLPNGYIVLDNFKDQFILAEHINKTVPEPFVVWDLDRDGNTINGRYCASIKNANIKFERLCSNWIAEHRWSDTAIL